MKITPAHDPNDYEVGLRHNLPMINVLTPDGRVARIVEPDGTTNYASASYEGLTFAVEGRKKVIADLESRGLLDRVEDYEIELGHSDRSKLPIEPFLSDQWFVKTGDVPEPRAKARGSGQIQLPDGSHTSGLAQAAIDAVQDGRISVFPSRYAKSYLDWLGEKRDWCISRQLWWGHRLSVWSQRFAENGRAIQMREKSANPNINSRPWQSKLHNWITCKNGMKTSDGGLAKEELSQPFRSMTFNFGKRAMWHSRSASGNQRSEIGRL